MSSELSKGEACDSISLAASTGDCIDELLRDIVDELSFGGGRGGTECMEALRICEFSSSSSVPLSTLCGTSAVLEPDLDLLLDRMEPLTDNRCCPLGDGDLATSIEFRASRD